MQKSNTSTFRPEIRGAKDVERTNSMPDFPLKADFEPADDDLLHSRSTPEASAGFADGVRPVTPNTYLQIQHEWISQQYQFDPRRLIRVLTSPLDKFLPKDINNLWNGIEFCSKMKSAIENCETEVAEELMRNLKSQTQKFTEQILEGLIKYHDQSIQVKRFDDRFCIGSLNHSEKLTKFIRDAELYLGFVDKGPSQYDGDLVSAWEQDLDKVCGKFLEHNFLSESTLIKEERDKDKVEKCIKWIQSYTGAISVRPNTPEGRRRSLSFSDKDACSGSITSPSRPKMKDPWSNSPARTNSGNHSVSSQIVLQKGPNKEFASSHTNLGPLIAREVLQPKQAGSKAKDKLTAFFGYLKESMRAKQHYLNKLREFVGDEDSVTIFEVFNWINYTGQLTANLKSFIGNPEGLDKKGQAEFVKSHIKPLFWSKALKCKYDLEPGLTKDDILRAVRNCAATKDNLYPLEILSILLSAEVYNNNPQDSLFVGGDANIADKKSGLAEKLGLNAVDENGKTALMLAAEHNNRDSVQFLCQLDADVNITDSKGDTAAMLAAKNDNSECLEHLLTYGAMQLVENKSGECLADVAQVNCKSVLSKHVAVAEARAVSRVVRSATYDAAKKRVKWLLPAGISIGCDTDLGRSCSPTNLLAKVEVDRDLEIINGPSEHGDNVRWIGFYPPDSAAPIYPNFHGGHLTIFNQQFKDVIRGPHVTMHEDTLTMSGFLKFLCLQKITQALKASGIKDISSSMHVHLQLVADIVSQNNSGKALELYNSYYNDIKKEYDAIQKINDPKVNSIVSAEEQAVKKTSAFYKKMAEKKCRLSVEYVTQLSEKTKAALAKKGAEPKKILLSLTQCNGTLKFKGTNLQKAQNHKGLATAINAQNATIANQPIAEIHQIIKDAHSAFDRYTAENETIQFDVGDNLLTVEDRKHLNDQSINLKPQTNADELRLRELRDLLGSEKMPSLFKHHTAVVEEQKAYLETIKVQIEEWKKASESLAHCGNCADKPLTEAFLKGLNNGENQAHKDIYTNFIELTNPSDLAHAQPNGRLNWLIGKIGECENKSLITVREHRVFYNDSEDFFTGPHNPQKALYKMNPKGNKEMTLETLNYSSRKPRVEMSTAANIACQYADEIVRSVIAKVNMISAAEPVKASKLRRSLSRDNITGKKPNGIVQVEYAITSIFEKEGIQAANPKEPLGSEAIAANGLYSEAEAASGSGPS